jgi:ZIP family zinc transporter
MPALVLSLAALLSTLGGGLFALRFRSSIHLILAFTAGVLLGVVSFDLLPEIFDPAARIGADAVHAMIALVLGFLLFHGLEKFVLVHHGHEADYASHHHPKVGVLSALAPVVGAASTLAFSVPPSLLVLYLGSGFLLYIGASDILPEAHSRAGPKTAGGLIGLTCLGAAFIFAVVQATG